VISYEEILSDGNPDRSPFPWI